MTRRHRVELQIPAVQRRDKANKLQLSFLAAVHVELPHRGLLTPDELWKQLIVVVDPSFYLSIKLQWKGEPFADAFGGISEALGKKLVNAGFWEQLSFKPSLSISSAAEIVIRPKHTVPLPIPPPNTPTSHLKHVSLTYSWRPYERTEKGNPGVEELLPFTDLALRSLFLGALGKNGAAGGIFLPGYAADISEREKHWDRVSSSVLSVVSKCTSKNGEGGLQSQLDELRNRSTHPDIAAHLKSGIHRMTSSFLISKPRKGLPSFANCEGLDLSDAGFRDLIAEDEVEAEAAEAFRDLLAEYDDGEDDNWLLDDAEHSQTSLDREMLKEEDEDVLEEDDGPPMLESLFSSEREQEARLERESLNEGEGRLMLDDETNIQHLASEIVDHGNGDFCFSHDAGDDGDSASVHSMLEDDPSTPPHGEETNSMLDDSDTQSVFSDVPLPTSPLLFPESWGFSRERQTDEKADSLLLRTHVGEDLLEEDIDMQDMIEF